ncbi:hypothetical protein TrVFT333_002468 [Trichoderma virens FT-333]|nr:hypothetical protein TrVFT333_002468 [Trichoderma virens FT-333]
MTDPKDYTIGWICAVEIEYLAAKLCLDDEQARLKCRPPQRDTNTYSFGKVAQHNIVIASLPDGSYGTSSAAIVATNLLRSFPNVRIVLMVGIGGGAPSFPDHDIRLGDVVVSAPRNGKSGVMQYDFGKTIQDQDFQETRFLNQPPTALRTAVTDLKVEHRRRPGSLEETINSILEKQDKEVYDDFSRPDASSDRLYRSNFVHATSDKGSCAETCGVDPLNLISRPQRTKQPHSPTVHYGLIASGNQLMKDALRRDELADKEEVLCFEMEAAGLMADFPCLVIRGICDYSDTHKNDEWQAYAALAAGAYAKSLLQRIPTYGVEAEERIVDIVSVVKKSLDDTSRGVHDLLSRHRDEENDTILDWLTHVNYVSRHNDVISMRQLGTGHWLLESDEFQSWMETRKRTLFCPGIPGAGKTVMTAVVVDYLLSRFRDDNRTGVAYIYCDFRRQDEQKAEGLFLSVLKQLAQKQHSLPLSVRTLYDSQQKSHTRPSLDEILRTLHLVVAAQSRTFIVVDALDECNAPSRARFLSEIHSLQAKTGANILATSRFDPGITNHFKDMLYLEIRAATEDIGKYLDARMLELPDFVNRHPELREEVKCNIIQQVDGMFLLAHFHMSSLIGQVSIKGVRVALAQLPTGNGAYDQVYQGAMERIEQHAPGWKELAKEVLSWVTHARRPLKKPELEHALAVELGKSEIEQDMLPHLMVELCAGLVTVDEESNTVRLVHYTAQEYFERTRTHWFPDAESEITRICVTYLLFSVFESGVCLTDQEFEGRLKSNKLYDYAAHNWGHHARKASILHPEVIEFLGCETKVEASSQALIGSKRHPMDSEYSQRFPKRMAGLHLAAYFGIETAVEALLHKGHEPDLLTDNGADLESKDGYDRTPLSEAVENGHEAVVKLLLEKGANLEAQGDCGGTVLSCAIQHCEVAIVKLLLERGADLEATDDYGGTPLLWAAERRHPAVVKLLCDRGVTLKLVENGTPLSDAADEARAAVIRRAYQWIADWRRNEDYCGLPLSKKELAVFIKRLHGMLGPNVSFVESGVNLEEKDNSGKTPF